MKQQNPAFERLKAQGVNPRTFWQEAQVIQETLNRKGAQCVVLPPPHSFATSGYVVYRLVHGDNVALSKVLSKGDELDEALSAFRGSETRVRLAKLPLRVEVERRNPQTLNLFRELEATGLNGNGRVLMSLGETVRGRSTAPAVLDLSSPNTPHLLVAGTTGSGKTNALIGMVVSLAWFSPPERLSILVLDPKAIDMNCLNGLPHLAWPVVTDANECVRALRTAVQEMERRKQDAQAEPEGRGNADPDHRLVIVFDEMADLIDVAGKEVVALIKRLIQAGRGLGIHMIAATQKPNVGQVGSVVKANFPARLCLRVMSDDDAKVAMGMYGTGAERLPGKGAGLLLTGGGLHRIQGYLSEKGAVSRWCEELGRNTAARRPVEVMPMRNVPDPSTQTTLDLQAEEPAQRASQPIARPAGSVGWGDGRGAPDVEDEWWLDSEGEDLGGYEWLIEGALRYYEANGKMPSLNALQELHKKKMGRMVNWDTIRAVKREAEGRIVEPVTA